MSTYKQEVKSLSRDELWEHAIFSLTSDRNNIKILNEKNIIKTWDYIYRRSEYTKKSDIFKSPNIEYLLNWLNFPDSTYGNKRIPELKIIYFCGPEPENDIDVILKYGVRLENLWAIESGEGSYRNALERARSKFPMLKIYKGKIDVFFKIYPIKFDIIYLDFTKTLFSEFKTIHAIFDCQALAQLGILIINTTAPDKNAEYIDFLSKFYVHSRCIEGKILESKEEKKKNRENWFGFISEYGYYEMNQIKHLIDDNYEEAYSTFNTLYPMEYASSIAPLYSISKSETLCNKIFKEKNSLEKYISIDILKDEEKFYDYEIFNDYWEYFFVDSLNESINTEGGWKNHYNGRGNSIIYNRTEVGKLISYISCHDKIGNILSDEFKQSVKSTYEKMQEIERGRFFCDVLFPNVLVEIFINQVGFIYHPVMSNHKRHKYTAKERTMYCDIFTFDQCRSFYDWMPLIEFYDENIGIYEKQMITRCCIDTIGRQYCFTPIITFNTGSSIIGDGEEKFVEYVHQFPKRVNLNNK